MLGKTWRIASVTFMSRPLRHLTCPISPVKLLGKHINARMIWIRFGLICPHFCWWRKRPWMTLDDFGWPWLGLIQYDLITVALHHRGSGALHHCLTNPGRSIVGWKHRRWESMPLLRTALRDTIASRIWSIQKNCDHIFTIKIYCSANFRNGLPDFSQSTSWQSSRLYAFLSSMAGACAATTGHHPGSRDGEGENLWDDHD